MHMCIHNRSCVWTRPASGYHGQRRPVSADSPSVGRLGRLAQRRPACFVRSCLVGFRSTWVRGGRTQANKLTQGAQQESSREGATLNVTRVLNCSPRGGCKLRSGMLYLSPPPRSSSPSTQWVWWSGDWTDP